MKRSFFILFLVLRTCLLSGQDSVSITLDEAFLLAEQSSLAHKLLVKDYLIKHWEFNSFKTQMLPKVKFNSNPFTYDRLVTKRYDSETNRDLYRPQETLNSYYSLSMNQAISSTGTSLFMNSDFNSLFNYQQLNSIDTTIRDYNITPFRIGIDQPIMAFNELKWQKRIEPKIYEASKLEYISEKEKIKSKIAEFFFDVMLAKNRLLIQSENVDSSEELLEIGQRKYEIGSIEREDLLNLQLTHNNAVISLASAVVNYENALKVLSDYIGVKLQNSILPVAPTIKDNFRIDLEDAVVKAIQSHPDSYKLQIQSLEAKRDLDQAIKENRFDISVVASYGLNNQSNSIGELFDNYLDQQLVAVNLEIPIIDWGERKSEIRIAEITNDKTKLEIAQSRLNLEQSVFLKVKEFNLQKELVENSSKSMALALESYELTKKRFKSGNADIVKLNSSRELWQSSVTKYYESISNYWINYYQIEEMTLFDFLNNRTLKNDLKDVEDI